MRRAEEMGRHLVSQIAGYGGNGKSHRLAARAAHSRTGVPDADSRVPELLRQDGHQHGQHPGQVYRHGISGYSHLRRCRAHPGSHLAQEAVYI